MHKLYTRRHTGGFPVEVALVWSGAAYERVDVPKSEQQNFDFLKLSPFGQVPVLQLADGAVMTESAAMCILIADRHPEAMLAPMIGHPDRAVFLRWLLFMTSVLYPAVLRRYYAERYTTDSGGSEAVADAALAEFERAFDVIEDHLSGREWLCDARSIADVYLLMMQTWYPDDELVRAKWPNIERIASALREEPRIRMLNDYYDMWN
jgi:glutathione S-transferase